MRFFISSEICFLALTVMPVAQCMPVPRERPELLFDTLEGEAANRHIQTVANVLAAPNVYRKQYRQRK